MLKKGKPPKAHYFCEICLLCVEAIIELFVDASIATDVSPQPDQTLMTSGRNSRHLGGLDGKKRLSHRRQIENGLAESDPFIGDVI